MLYVVLFYLVFFGILAFLFTSSIFISGLIYSYLKGAPYVPTEKKIILRILQKAQLKKGMRFLELGCGTGRIVAEAVSQYGVNGIGIEINPILYQGAQLRKWISRIDDLDFLRKNINDLPFHNYDVIYLFLFPRLIEKIEPRLLGECKKGTVIISHGFRIDKLKSKQFDTIEDHTFKTFYYRI